MTVYRAQQVSHQNLPPNRSEPRFSFICWTLAPPKLFPMDFLEHLVCSQTCVWYRTRTTHNLSPNEHTKRKLCPNNRPTIINKFGPTLSHLLRAVNRQPCFRAGTRRARVRTQPAHAARGLQMHTHAHEPNPPRTTEPNHNKQRRPEIKPRHAETCNHVKSMAPQHRITPYNHRRSHN